MTTTKRTGLLALAVTFSAGIHAALAPEHLREMPPLGYSFIAAAVIGAGIAGALITRPHDRRIPSLAALFLIGQVLVWVLFVTVHVPGFMGTPESVETIALVCKAAELLAIAIALPLVVAGRAGSHRWGARQGESRRGSLVGLGNGWRSVARARRLVAVALGAVMLVVLVVGGGRIGAGRASADAQVASGQSGGRMFVPTESDGPLVQPPVIASRRGVLKANVTLIRAGIPGSNRPILFGGLPIYSDPEPFLITPQPPARPPHFPLNFAAGFQFAAYGRTYRAQFPAPTLRVKPGDTLDLKSVDRLPDEPSGPRLPAGAQAWNLHTHGAVVSPLGDSDNVLRAMEPDKTYRTRVKITSYDGSGLDWYHPHLHGYVGDQLYAGLAGSLQVGDPLDPWPQFKGKYRERLLDLTMGLISKDDSGRRFLADLAPSDSPTGKPPNNYGTTWFKFVNGEYNPSITIRPGETQIWTFTNMSRNGNFNLGITDANGQHPWAATILSYEGYGKNQVPQRTTLGVPSPYRYNGPPVLDNGARITMAVTAPARPGTYYLADDMHVQLRPQSQPFALATIHVTGSRATRRPPVFSRTGPAANVLTAKPDHIRTFYWSNVTSGDTIKFAINGYVFPNSPIVTLQAGQVEQWRLINTSGVDHVFHIHQNHFAVISVNGSPVDYANPFLDESLRSPKRSTPSSRRYVSLRDTVDIPPHGTVVIRLGVSPELGKYVFHCHIVAHEDGGMMMGALTIPNQAQRRIALGTLPGQRSAVLVKDGNARPTGQQITHSNARGEVVTATGELNGDLTQAIAVGSPPRSGSPASVSVYDGKSLRRIARFIPFPQSPRARLSLAIGSVEGNGRGDIIVGRAGRGPSLVRIFRANGTVLRTISGAIPGILPNGVSVASADFNGDNYDDVAIGTGRGSRPFVVGLDGSTISQRSPTRLFAFQPAGGPTSGVNLAAGYYDPRTRPGIAANLITTPQTGSPAGQVQVWTPNPLGGEMGMGMGMGASTPPPLLMATLYPLGRHVSRGLRLAVTSLGKQGRDALVAWTDPYKPAYISISNRGVVSRIRTPTR